MTARRLKAEELRAICDPAMLPFRSTEELAPLDAMIGQKRALDATTFGIGVKHEGYNLFVLGPAATGKISTMRRLLMQAAAGEPPAVDYCYVHNFSDPYRPTALELPAGRGRELRDEMARLIEECQARLPKAFESEAFERRRSEILEDLARNQEREIAELETLAQAHGLAVVRTHGGLAVAPAPAGRALSHDEFSALPESTRRTISAGAEALEEPVEATLRRLRVLEREARAAHQQLVSEVATAATRQLIRELRERFAGLKAVQGYLDGVERDLIEHAELLRRRENDKPALPFLPAPHDFLDRYRVNVLVDRGGARGAPVVLEPNPTHGNLLGRIEHHVHFGALVTDFTLIKPGALHQANGGYLILDAKDVLLNFLAWAALKKALKGRSIRIQEPLEEMRLVTAATLAPEPIPLTVKVVLIGTPLLYYLLYNLDEDFRESFKVKVDFDDSLPHTPEVELLLARFVAATCREDGLPHFSAGGVSKLVEHSSRLVAHQGRLSARLGLLRDLIREAAFRARQDAHTLVGADDVTRAIADWIHRANLLEERMARLIAEGELLISTEGEAVGQVNGVSVLSSGDHAFGRPSRITVRTFTGEPGVVDIEREAKLGGPVHSKGVMILTGFLAGRYARQSPLALSASIAFEQHYEEDRRGQRVVGRALCPPVEPQRDPPQAGPRGHGLGNQQGQIQPVGAVNEKIEGFFDVCRARGLTGRHGVVIPEVNSHHLMLREDVLQAVREERFDVYAISTVDEGLALLSDREAGERGADGQFPPGSFNVAVERALAENVTRLRLIRGEPPAAHPTRGEHS